MASTMTRRGRALAKIHLGTYLVFTALIVVLGLAALARRLIQGRVFSLRKAAAILLILPLIGIGLAIMGETGLFDRMAEPTRRWWRRGSDFSASNSHLGRGLGADPV